MAETSIPVVQNQFSCPVCLDTLNVPVTIPCGHSYCMSCITGCWDQDDQKGVYSCPQCRQTFTPRPVLGKNTMLAEVVENLKRKLQAAGPADCYTGSGDVECDVCTGKKEQAVKSCLMCLESYCQTHFERHEEFHSRKRHKVIDATGRLHEMICPQHDKLLEFYCRTDQQCICTLCMQNEHENHDTASPAAERTEKQRLLGETRRKFVERIQERETELEELKEAVESHKRSAQAAVEDSEKIFTELIRSIERSRSEVTQLIRDQERATVSRAEGLLERLEQEIADLRRRDTELEQFSHTEDHIHFLQNFQSNSVPPGSTDLSSVTLNSLFTFDDIGSCVSQLRKKLEHVGKEEQENILCRVKCIQIIPTPEYESREEFLRHFQQFTFDANTAHMSLSLSEWNRVITYGFQGKHDPYHPARFAFWEQVLCKESVGGRCYWEVEWSGRVNIAVSYKSIRRGRGHECKFGCNDQSWSLYCSDTTCSFMHNNRSTTVPVKLSSSRIGVYVDHRAGTLSFYRVSDTMTLIHRVQTTFSKPLYPGFRVYRSVKLCDRGS